MCFLFSDVIFGALSSLAIILLSKRELVALLYFNCVVAACILCLFLMVPWVGLQYEILTFPGHTHYYLSKDVLISVSKSLQSNQLLAVWRT